MLAAPRPVRPCGGWCRPRPATIQTIHVTLDGELLVVGFALDVGHCVGRQGFAASLQNFLQPGLGILLLYARAYLVQAAGVPAKQQGPHPLQIGIQIDGADHRLDRVGQDRLAAEPAAFQLAGPQDQVIPEVKLPAELGQGLLAHQGGTHAAEIPFRRLREAVEEIIGNHQTQDGVPQKFQSLIVTGTGAAVGQRPGQQLLILKDMPETGLQSVHLDIHLLDSANAVEAHTGRHPAWQAGSFLALKFETDPDGDRLAYQVLLGHEAPETTVGTVVAVVTHHEIVAFRHHPLIRVGTGLAIVAIHQVRH